MSSRGFMNSGIYSFSSVSSALDTNAWGTYLGLFPQEKTPAIPEEPSSQLTNIEENDDEICPEAEPHDNVSP